MRFLKYAIVCTLFIGCIDTRKKITDKVGFMVGTWKNSNEKGMFEKWDWQGNLLSGSGYSVKENDTTVWELLTIKTKGEDLYYIADVKQNDEPVAFKLVEDDANMAVFLNVDHDFPKKITYIFNQPNLLYAKLEGNNKERRIAKEFYFERVD